MTGLKNFLKERLVLKDEFIKEDMGEVVIKRSIKQRPKNKHEVCLIFDSKQARDLVKAQGHHLTNHREEAGMRLQIPDHLQKNFRTLMSVAYDLKKTNRNLRCNIKFDEDTLGLYMDIQKDNGEPWKRIHLDLAARTLGSRSCRRSGAPAKMEDDEILSLLGDASE